MELPSPSALLNHFLDESSKSYVSVFPGAKKSSSGRQEHSCISRVSPDVDTHYSNALTLTLGKSKDISQEENGPMPSAHAQKSQSTAGKRNIQGCQGWGLSMWSHTHTYTPTPGMVLRKTKKTRSSPCSNEWLKLHPQSSGSLREKNTIEKHPQ